MTKQCVICGNEFQGYGITCSKPCSLLRSKERWSEWAKKDRKDNPEKWKEKWKKLRENNLEKHKEWDKKWKKENPEKRKNQKKRHREKIRDSLSDRYVVKYLCKDNHLKLKDIPPEIIELKRRIIKANRLINQKSK